MSVKPEGLLGDIKTTNVFHHPVKAKISISILKYMTEVKCNKNLPISSGYLLKGHQIK